jgi:TRAP-type C4-dicarboxylate transport system permease small subunit
VTPGGQRPADETTGLLGWADRLGRLAENVFLGLLLFGMIFLAAAQVGLRELWGQGIAWGDEALRLLVLWAAMAGAVAASRDEVHLRIDLATRFLPARPVGLVAVVVDLFTAAVAGILAWHSWRFVAESREFGDVVLGGQPAWIYQAVLPVAFVLIAWRYLVWFGRRCRDLLAGRAAALPQAPR